MICRPLFGSRFIQLDDDVDHFLQDFVESDPHPRASLQSNQDQKEEIEEEMIW